MIDITRFHRAAMARTDEALDAQRLGEEERAQEHFRAAYDLELQAANVYISMADTEPTRSVLLRSAASLALDCRLPREAEKLLCLALGGEPPADIAEELRDLLEQAHFQRHLDLRGVVLAAEEFQMSITGDSVGFGVAPTEAFLDRVEQAEMLVYRTAERRLGRPYRDRGRRPKELGPHVQLFMTTPRAASFAVTFRVGQPHLPGLSFGEEVVDEFLTCLDLFTRGDDSILSERIPDEAYRRNFIGIARQLSPDGRDVSVVGFTATAHGKERRIALNKVKGDIPPSSALSGREIPNSGSSARVTGELKGADSVKEGRNKLKIVTEDRTVYPVVVPPGMMSDIVKPMWDERVIVTGTWKGKQIHLESIDRVD